MKYTEATAQRKSADRFYSIWAVCFLLHENREEERVGVCRASSPWPAARCSAACWSSARTSTRTPAFPEQLGNHRRQREETDNIHDSWKKTWLQASRQQAQEIKTVRFNWKHAREQRNMSGIHAIRRWESNLEESARDSKSSYKEEQTFTAVHV